MGFLEHLEELRKRIIRACIAVGVGMLVAFLFVDRIADFVLAPTLLKLPPGTNLIFTKPGEGFSFYRIAAEADVPMTFTKSAQGTGAPWIGTIRETSSFSVCTSV